jgi:NADP-dependent 3-hydroxy acid dehydrogenase YdfG
MKVAITGHTKGIGAEIFQYFSSKEHDCIGFSRSNGHDISVADDRKRIVEQSIDCDIFVNNACTRSDDAQLYMLDEVYKAWEKENKIIINISSRAGDFIDSTNHPHHYYFVMKNKQDKYCTKHSKNVWLINLRPGTVDTPLTHNWPDPKMNINSISKVLDFVFTNKEFFKVKSITFGL